MDRHAVSPQPLPDRLRGFLADRRSHWSRRGGQLLLVPSTAPARPGFTCDEHASLVLAERQEFAVEWSGGRLRATEDDAILAPAERAYRHRWDPRRRYLPGLVIKAIAEDILVQQRNADPRRWGELSWRFAAETGGIFRDALALIVRLRESPDGGTSWTERAIRHLVATAIDAVLAAADHPRRAVRGGKPVAVRCRSYLRRHLGEADLRVGAVAAALGYDPDGLGRRYRRETGQTLRETLVQLRVQRARELLRRRDLPIAEIAAACGFNDPTHFARTFRRIQGYAPREFRRFGHLEEEGGA